MKKLTCLLLAIIMTLTLAACQKDGNTPADTNGTDAPVEMLDLIADGKNQYSIVLPKGCSATVTEASTELMNAMKEIGGKKPDRYYDNTDKNPENEKEILIGVTARDASKNAVERVAEGEYLIEVSGSKLVIVAANEHLLLSAVKALSAAWTVSGKSASLPKSFSMRQNLSNEMISLFSDGAFRYSVIYDKDLSDASVEAVNAFATGVKNAFKCDALTVKNDKEVEAKTSTYEILIGLTNRKASKNAYTSLSQIGYTIAVSGNKIVLAASNESLLQDAIDALLSELKAVKDGTSVGSYMLKNDYSRNVFDFGSSDWFVTVPALTAGTFGSAYSGDDNSCIMEREGVTADDFDAYVAALTAAGFTGGEDYTLDQNKYALRHGEKATVYVSYSAVAETIRLYTEKKGTFNYPEKGTVSDNAQKTPVLWQLEVENLASRENGGMSYVFLTENDTFVVIDGGYWNASEADNLYNFLKEKTPAGKETVIEAWYISHLHSDHYGALFAFSQKYSSKVDVKSFYYHFDYLGKVGTSQANFKDYTSRGLWSDAVHYGNLHTGMEFNIGGVQFHVLYTLEDLYPETAEDFDFNNTSTVLRATVKGQRVLFLGDIMNKGCWHMTDTLSIATLRSDIVQFSHHGYEGGTRILYDSIAAGTVLWPMNVVANRVNESTPYQNVFKTWHDNTSATEGPIYNYYICYQASYVKQIIVAGMGDYEINFPFTPSAYPETGTRLPDFETYYEEKVAELQGGN